MLGLGSRCCCCCCCWGVGLLLLLVLFLPASRRFSIDLSLSSNLFSMSAIMVSIAAWVMPASRMFCGMRVGLGVLRAAVVVVVVEEEGVIRCCGGVVAVCGEVVFPLFFVVVATCCARFKRSFACLLYGVSGVWLPESVPMMVEGWYCGGREENLTLLSSGALELGA